MRMILPVVAIWLVVIAAARGPWDNDVLVYRVGPGGKVTQVATFERAGVATIARMKDV